MEIQRVNRSDAEKVFVQGFNQIGSTISAGYLTCWHVRTVASANGVNVASPVTSALPAFAGVFDADTTSGNYGPVQAYGFSNKTFCSASGGETLAPGQVVGPVDGQVYANSSGQSTNLGPIIILSQRVGGNAPNPTFIRAL
jgi:hypothetical protein